ncbi:TetR/AcrR family transcriptional regulator [Paenibacillus silviterrae]|uniref:TetR/AcrR family transcriptional regulator n=1 Tax=Paenibacillus silviterrae TaxID=3242194 RepID=UPI0025430D18|nr:TetR/AcrR family transcriptional regulator [Paenibacillus chinjuensis]
MKRIIKQPEERRREIMNTSRELFISQGYEKTSINDIIHKMGVAKGTFYHYFKSKEEIADAVIRDALEKVIEAFHLIRLASDLNAIDKLNKIIRFFLQEATIHYHTGLMKYLHREDNIRLHKKMKVALINEFVPIISEVVMQGIDEKVFNTDYPQETTEFLLIGMNFMLDPSYFSWSEQQYFTKLDAVIEIFEKILGTPKGSFPLVKEHLKKML